jgi:oxygen-independent coproporphyrinogen-3 oxidase
MDASPQEPRQFDPALWADVDGPVHLYVHLPFCPRKCRFCFYYTVRSYNPARCLRYVDRVLDELRAYAAAGAFARARVRSVYLGGGTPTVAGETALRRLLAGILDTVPVEDGAEITAEAFPEPILYEVLPALREAGVNRLSLGIQTLDADVLTLNKRVPAPDQSLQSLEFLRFAQAVGLANVNIDLMYGIPGQSLSSLIATMDGCLAERPAHVTAYRCVITPGTAIFRMGGIDGVPLPGKAEKDRLGQHCLAALHDRGYARYAVDHFASAEQYRSMHEIGVWSGDNFIGLGASGFSQVDGKLYRNKRSIHKYLDPEAAFPLAEFYALTPQDCMRRWLLLCITKLLRADAADFQRRFGARLDTELGVELDDLAQRGWLLHVPDGVSRLTDAGAENIHALSLVLTGFHDPSYERMVTRATASSNSLAGPSGRR